MPQGSDLYDNALTKVMLWGKVGAGKTCAWGQAMKLDEISTCYCFDFDGRLASLRKVISRDILEKKLVYDTYQDGKTPGLAYNKARAQLSRLQQMPEDKLPSLVAVDTLTTLAQGVLASVLIQGGKYRDDIPSQQDYLQAIRLILPFVQDLVALKTNVALTVHEETYTDKQTESVFKDIYTYPSLRNVLPGLFNEFWHCEVNTGGVYKIRTRSNAIFSARTCIPGLADLEDQDAIWRKAIPVVQTPSSPSVS